MRVTFRLVVEVYRLVFRLSLMDICILDMLRVYV